MRGLVANCRETMQNSCRCRGVREVVYTAIIFTVILMAMFTRRLDLPERSFFLLGPRGTGKTTWLRGVLPSALWFDLLRTGVFLELSQQPIDSGSTSKPSHAEAGSSSMTCSAYRLY